MARCCATDEESDFVRCSIIDRGLRTGRSQARYSVASLLTRTPVPTVGAPPHCRSRITGCRERLSCCGARKNLRACAFLDFFDRCHSFALPFSATGSGRARPLRVGAPPRRCSRIHLIRFGAREARTYPHWGRLPNLSLLTTDGYKIFF